MNMTSAPLHLLPLPSDDDRRLIDVTVADLRRIVAAEVQKLSTPEMQRPLTPKEIGALYGVAEDRVREWIADGMPHVRVGDRRGLRIWPDKARTWLEENRG